MVLDKRKFKLRGIVKAIKISEGNVFTILNEQSDKKAKSYRWSIVWPSITTEEIKKKRPQMEKNKSVCTKFYRSFSKLGIFGASINPVSVYIIKERCYCLPGHYQK